MLASFTLQAGWWELAAIWRKWRSGATACRSRMWYGALSSRGAANNDSHYLPSRDIQLTWHAEQFRAFLASRQNVAEALASGGYLAQLWQELPWQRQALYRPAQAWRCRLLVKTSLKKKERQRTCHVALPALSTFISLYRWHG